MTARKVYWDMISNPARVKPGGWKKNRSNYTKKAPPSEGLNPSVKFSLT
jgi:hypothetical protein